MPSRPPASSTSRRTSRAAGPVATPRRTGARSATAALNAWLREHAQPFDPARGPGAAQLAGLRGSLQDARVLLLGESAPAARETVQLRLALLRVALARGFNVLGMPCAPSTAMRVQRRLEGALAAPAIPGTAAERLFIDGLRRSARLRAGLQLFGTALSATGDAAGLRADAHALLDELLDEQLAKPPRPSPGATAGATVQPSGNAHRRVADLRRLLAPSPDEAGEATDAAAERLAWALDWMDMQFAPLTDALGSAGYARLRNLMQWLHDTCVGAAPDDITQGQLAFALAERWPEQRALLYGGCEDMLRDDARADVARAARTLPAGDAQVAARSAGDFVARTLLPQHSEARRTAVFWCLHGGGQRSKGTARRGAQQRLPADSLNARLAALGSAFVLPLHALDDPRAAPLREPQRVVTADGTRITLPLQPQLDALFFLPSADDCA